MIESWLMIQSPGTSVPIDRIQIDYLQQSPQVHLQIN